MPDQPTTPKRTADMFEHLDATSLPSAAVVAPLLVDMVAPRSVVDVGCGTGAWLDALREVGVTDLLGIDGDYVERHRLVIPPSEFRAHDLTRPISIGRSFDLAISLEVGEHLPEASATTLVATLTDAAPVVLFSAAIPGQGGIGHINEQWPRYWETKFADRGYKQLDVFRSRLWHDDRVAYWYRQNMFLYAVEDVAAQVRARAGEIVAWPTDVVHPGAFARATRKGELANHSIKAIARAAPGSLRRALRDRRT